VRKSGVCVTQKRGFLNHAQFFDGVLADGGCN